MYSPLPQVPSMTEVPKSVGKVRLVSGALEAECGAKVGQCRFVHVVAVLAKSF